VLFYAASLGGVLLTIRAVLFGAPPLWLSVAAVHAYIALMLAGVFVLRLRMFADAVIKGPEGAQGVVLTFDDGPDPKSTRKVLDILDEHDVKATFFVIGKKVDLYPSVVEEIVQRGHEVGVHGYEHDRLFSLRGPSVVRDDLVRAVASIEKVTKKKPTLFRPPIGHTNPTIARVADELGLTVVGWSVAAYDGIARAKPSRVASRVKAAMDDRDIILMHDASERGTHDPAGPKALPEILLGAKDRNLRFVPLSDWLDD
jgi:peptidoglycan/xylan/chitin deacetylase (PgdA/CDA1 family)